MSSNKTDTRHRILNATWKLLEKSGGKPVKLSDIARAAGVSRQAIYLHFVTRADLMKEAARHVDEMKDIDERLAASRRAADGEERLDAFVEAWGNYIPEIYPVGRELMAMGDTDEAAAEAWADRMKAVRHGCRAAVDALARDGRLSDDLSRDEATDLLQLLLRVENWQFATQERGWSQADYIEHMQRAAHRALVEPEHRSFIAVS